MDTLAAIAFGGESARIRYMHEKPKRRNEKIVTGQMFAQIAFAAAWVVLVSILITKFDPITHIFRGGPTGEYILTAYFTFFVFIALFNAFNARVDGVNLLDGITKNKPFIGVILLCVVIQVFLTMFGGEIFNCFGMNGAEWIVVLLLSITVIPFIELIKTLGFARMKESLGNNTYTAMR
jgi:magnesium-transporting ATPase (P-type)